MPLLELAPPEAARSVPGAVRAASSSRREHLDGKSMVGSRKRLPRIPATPYSRAGSIENRAEPERTPRTIPGKEPEQPNGSMKLSKAGMNN